MTRPSPRPGPPGDPHPGGGGCGAWAQQHTGAYDFSAQRARPQERRDLQLIRRIGEITALRGAGRRLDWGRFPPRPRWRVMSAGDVPTRKLRRNPRTGAPLRRRHGARLAGHAGGTPSFSMPRTAGATANFLIDGGTGGVDQGDNSASESELRDVDWRRLRAALWQPAHRPPSCSVLLQRQRRERMHGYPTPHRCAEGPHGLRWPGARGLERPRAATGMHPRQLRRGAECRTRRVHGPRRLARATCPHTGASNVRRDLRRTARPMRCAASCASAGAPAWIARDVPRRGRSPAASSCWARPRTVRWRARRCASRWCC